MPLAASLTAVANPMPLLAPVMMATCMGSFSTFVISLQAPALGELPLNLSSSGLARSCRESLASRDGAEVRDAAQNARGALG